MENTQLPIYKLISFDKIPSTQTYAHELIAAGSATDRTVVMADTQTDGYGRYRRSWVSHNGNLYASFIYQIEDRDPRLSYYIAVAVAETLLSFNICPSIKWPNDILIDGKKVCGILIEYSKKFVVVGIGINIKSNPTNLAYQTTKLSDYADLSRHELLAELMKSLDKWLDRDFALVQKRWTDLAASLNKTIRHRGAEAELIGINENGALILRRGEEYILTYGDEISL